MGEEKTVDKESKGKPGRAGRFFSVNQPKLDEAVDAMCKAIDEEILHLQLQAAAMIALREKYMGLKKNE